MKIEILKWYSQKEVQSNLIEIAKDREVVCVFADSSFGKRPDMILYPKDIINAVENGAISFHGSIEKWQNPMKLEAGMSKSMLDEMRKGWDIFIDVDVKNFEIAKIATRQIIESLKDFGIESYSIKFTGGNSFHVAIPFESMPTQINFQSTSKLYPELQEKIIGFLKWYSEDLMRDAFLSFGNVNEIASKLNKSIDEILTKEKLDPFKVINLDVFGSRHLFRMPFALNEKTLLVSLPINEKRIEKFSKEDAKIENAKIEEKFLIKKKIGDAEALIIEALDWYARYGKEELIVEKVPFVRKRMRKVSEEFFPPCIKKILNGLSDGRKRSVFILITFLRNMGWKDEEIEKRIDEWNEKNYPPLRFSYLRTQLRWHFRQDRNILPPSCEHETFYRNMNVCMPDKICEKEIKNPINYPFKILRKKI